MYSTSTVDLKVYSAEQFKESIAANNQIYFAYGKVDNWTNEPIPDAANSSISTSYEFWKNMIGAKRITEGDVRHVCPRFDWTSNTVYVAYDHLDSTLYNAGVNFYVMNSQYNVYKCINNANNSPSTFEPLTVSTNTVIQTADGYVWKYMYNVNTYERQRFMTAGFIPVKTITSDNGTNQWAVQQSAIDGAIHSVIVTNGGNNYTNVSNLVVSIRGQVGEGSGATAVATINSATNTVNSIYITSVGSGYTEAEVVISGGGGYGAKARAIISPKGGHGSNPLYELGGKYIIVNPRLINTQSGLLPATNDYRQVAMIANPIIRNDTNVSSNLVISQTTDISLVGTSTDYIQDEWVYQGRSFAEATFKGKVVEWNSANGLLKLVNVYGDPLSEGLLGSNSFSSRFVSSVKYPDLEAYSGSFIYINNITPITRSSTQTEDFKIIIKF